MPDRRIIRVKTPLEIIVPWALPIIAGRFVLGHIAARNLLSEDRTAVFFVLAARPFNRRDFRFFHAVAFLAS